MTREVGSGLSIPLYRPGDEAKETPIGVVNFDALHFSFEQTKFDDEITVNLGITTASLAGILFE